MVGGGPGPCFSPCFHGGWISCQPSTMAASTVGHYVAVACQRYAQPDKKAPSYVVFTPSGREIRLRKSAIPPSQTPKPSRKRPALDEDGVRPTSAPARAPTEAACSCEMQPQVQCSRCCRFYRLVPPPRPVLDIGHRAPKLSQAGSKQETAMGDQRRQSVASLISQFENKGWGAVHGAPETARTSETLEVRQGTQGARCHLPCCDAWRQSKSKGKIHSQSCRCDRPCFDAGRA